MAYNTLLNLPCQLERWNIILQKDTGETKDGTT
jgi:hypothetical protein